MRRLSLSDAAAEAICGPLHGFVLLLGNLSRLGRRRMLSWRLSRAERLRIAALLRHRRMVLAPHGLVLLTRCRFGTLPAAGLSRRLSRLLRRAVHRIVARFPCDRLVVEQAESA